MFSKGKAPEAPASSSAPMSNPIPAPTAPKKSGGRSAPSIISADLLVQGTLTSQGDMQIDGTVEGDIRSVTLMIGNGATVKGEIVAEEVVVRGRVEGGLAYQAENGLSVAGSLFYDGIGGGDYDAWGGRAAIAFGF